MRKWRNSERQGPQANILSHSVRWNLAPGILPTIPTWAILNLTLLPRLGAPLCLPSPVYLGDFAWPWSSGMCPEGMERKAATAMAPRRTGSMRARRHRMDENDGESNHFRARILIVTTQPNMKLLFFFRSLCQRFMKKGTRWHCHPCTRLGRPAVPGEP